MAAIHARVAEGRARHATAWVGRLVAPADIQKESSSSTPVSCFPHSTYTGHQGHPAHHRQEAPAEMHSDAALSSCGSGFGGRNSQVQQCHPRAKAESKSGQSSSVLSSGCRLAETPASRGRKPLGAADVITAPLSKSKNSTRQKTQNSQSLVWDQARAPSNAQKLQSPARAGTWGQETPACSKILHSNNTWKHTGCCCCDWGLQDATSRCKRAQTLQRQAKESARAGVQETPDATQFVTAHHTPLAAARSDVVLRYCQHPAEARHRGQETPHSSRNPHRIP